MGNRSSITKSLLSHTVLLLFWEIYLIYLFLSAGMGNLCNSIVSISHITPIDMEDQGNVYLSSATCNKTFPCSTGRCLVLLNHIFTPCFGQMLEKVASR